MKRLLLIMFAFLGLFLYSPESGGQVTINETFDGTTFPPTGWAHSGFSRTTAAPCTGAGAARKNQWSSSTTGSLTSPAGTSNAQNLTISFNYKVVNYVSSGNPTTATPNTPAWGSIVTQVSTDGGTTWPITAGTIDASNHIVSLSCANKTYVVTGASVPNGNSIKVRWNLSWSAGDYFVYIDDVSITQPSTTPPNCATTPSPANAATNVALNAQLSWAVAAGATSYDVYFGTSTNPPLVGNVTTTTYNPGALTANTQYFWKIIPKNANGSATGCSEWTFTTLGCPGSLGAGTVSIASLPYSATALTNCGNGNNITSTNVASVCGSSNYYGGEDKTFIFTPSSSGDYVFTLTSTTTYTAMMLYNGCPFTASCVGNVQSSSSGTKTMTLSLTSGTTYYLVVDTWPTPNCIPSFDLSIAAALPPSCTTITTPANGATNVALAGNITFAAATGATSYDIYLSTGTPPTYHGNTTTTTYAYTGLTGNTLYYVQIIPKNANGSASGCTITSFTTVTPPPAYDEPCGAVALTLGQSSCINTVSCTVNAVTEPSTLPGGCSTVNNLAWYKFTTTVAGNYILTGTRAPAATDHLNAWVNIYTLGGTCSAPVWTAVNTSCIAMDLSSNPTVVAFANGLAASTEYYVLIDGNSGDVGEMCLQVDPPQPLPDCATLNTPTNGATGVAVNTPLTWTAPATGGTPTGYKVYLGTTTNPGLVTTVSAPNLTYTPSGQTFSTTYYWRIVPTNGTGDAVGCTTEFSYTTSAPPPPPDCATLNTPTNGATDVTLTTALTWTPAGTGGTPTSYKVYHGTANPPTTFNTVTAPTTTYTPTGRTYSTTYYWYVVPTNATGDAVGCNSTIFSYTTSAPPPPPANNDPGEATNVDQQLSSSCSTPLSGQTTESATETLAGTLCDGYTASSPIHDVWYKFIAQTPNLTVNVTTTTDVVLVIYLGDPTNGGTYVDCNDGAGSGETVSMTGLQVGKTYYYRVYPYSTSAVANFSTCVYGPVPASISLGSANTCTTARNILSTGSGKWLYITNTDGGVVAALKDDNALGNVATSFYINSGAVRTSGGIPYLDRNIEITPAVTNLGSTIRLYYTQAELDALNAVANPDLTPATMQGYKTSEACSGTQGTGTALTQSGNGTGSGGIFVEYTIPGFSSFFMQQAATLPIELLTFKGYADKNVNVLEWTTASEINTDKFIVERSIDSKKWEDVAEVESAGDSRITSSYKAIDDQPYSKAYYRLKSIDRDGRFQVSESIFIERNDRTFKLYSVSPNPNRGDFTVTFNAASDGESRLILVNSLGMRVHSQNVNSKAGTNAEYLNATDLTNGIYTLLIEQDGQIITQRVVINK